MITITSRIRRLFNFRQNTRFGYISRHHRPHIHVKYQSDEAVIAIPGGLVSDAATFNLLLAHCTTVWLQADPEDHMRRVVAQGDMRPMSASREAMEDLKGILAGRAAFYSKAELRLDTSAQPLQPTFAALRAMVRDALGIGIQPTAHA